MKLIKPMIGILATLIIFVTASCSNLTSTPTLKPATNPLTPGKQHHAKELHNWQLNGKIAVQSGREAGSANLNWTQRQDYYTISLTGPMGSNSILLSGQPGAVTLKATNGKQYRARSPEQLLAAQWGFHVPVSNMHYWIRGLPVPDMQAQTHYDRQGHLINLAQQGWRIDYLGYKNIRGVSLPDRLAITSPSLRVKIIIYNWYV